MPQKEDRKELTKFDKQTIHDIRNALVVIQGNNDLMETDKVFDVELSEAIQIGVVRIATILNDLDGKRRNL